MLIKTLPVGMLATNCYIVTDEKTMKCAIIDPGAESNTILDYIESNNLRPEVIFLTHGHFDHHMALDNVLDAINVPVIVSEKEINRDGQASQLKVRDDDNMKPCREGDVFMVGDLTFTVMETPGHSPGSITLICSTAVSDDPSVSIDTPAVLFTGDTLFCGDCGRTDLAGGNRETMLKSLRRLYNMDGDYEVYPGHDEPTSLDIERCMNRDMKFAIGEMNPEM